MRGRSPITGRVFNGHMTELVNYASDDRDFELALGALGDNTPSADTRDRREHRGGWFRRNASMLGLCAVALAAPVVALKSCEAMSRVEGSNDGAFCVADPVISGDSLRERLAAISVHDGKYVDGATVGVAPRVDGTFTVQGKPC